MLENRTTMNRYDVEIHKKFALAAACIVFVLLGAPIALRFPRGGVGLVIGVSLVVFALYYVGLIAGESLANTRIRHAVLGDVGGERHSHGRRRSCCCAGWARRSSTARGGDLRSCSTRSCATREGRARGSGAQSSEDGRMMRARAPARPLRLHGVLEDLRRRRRWASRCCSSSSISRTTSTSISTRTCRAVDIALSYLYWHAAIRCSW